MPTPPTREWPSCNQESLADRLAEVKAILRRHADRSRGTISDAQRTIDAVGDAPPPPEPAAGERDDGAAGHEDRPVPTLEALGAAFGLSRFERVLLLLCAGIELDSDLAPLCAAAQGDPAKTYPTFSLALAALPGAHWSALSPGRPLRRWRLIEVGAGPALTVSPLRIDERVLHHLVGISYLDDRLAAVIERVEPVASEELAASHARIAERLAAAWSAAQEGDGPTPLIQVCGRDPAERRAVAAAAATAAGLRLAAIPADLIPAAAADLDSLARLWEREAVLGGAALLVECDDSDFGSDPVRTRSIRRLAERIAGLVILSDRERRPIVHRRVIAFDIQPPTIEELRAAWQTALGSPADADRKDLDAIAAQFTLSLPALRSAASEALARGNGSAREIGLAVWDVCRASCRTHLEDLAQRIEPTAGWEDLVLPPPQAEVLRRIAMHVRHRATIHDTWGFAAKSGRGLGINALFTGLSGTGKTLAAEVLARELNLDLYRIDLASVVSKFIGETEKNLRRVFDAAEGSGAILLFDEADALFGKRSEVKDSHDRYANIEVSYLLQRMEAYRGLAVLTTNLKNALDPAFLRRIQFVVPFPFPDVAQRAEIWRRIFPASTPTEGLDCWKLAKLNVPGGNIRNIAVNAAFLAAQAGEPVRMTHLRDSARIEYLKLERPLTETEIGGWI